MRTVSSAEWDLKVEGHFSERRFISRKLAMTAFMIWSGYSPEERQRMAWQALL